LEPFKIGDVIAGKYEIARVLGRGGMGVVVAARHRELDEEVALKFLHPSLADRPESYARFTREARTATRIKSEHVARVFDVGTEAGVPFIVMECLTGEDLTRVLQRRGPLPPAEAVDLLLQACEALAEAHKLGIVHRDLKPANLFVTTRPDGTPCIKVLDFGIARSTSLEDVSVTASAAVVGTPLYMSPEQLASSRTADARCDVWALGVILYELVTGQRPFSGESFATIAAAILGGSFPPPSELRPAVPAPLEQAIAETLARDPESRPSSVAAFAARIAPCGSDAARASCRRIERIAARASTSIPPAESPEATLADGPPSSVARALQAPQEVTLAPALSQSVDTAERRRVPRLAKVAIGACCSALLLSWIILSLPPKPGGGREGGSPAEGAPETPSAQGVTAAAGDAAAIVAAPDAGDAGAGWRAHLVTLRADSLKDVDLSGVALGDFAVAAPPSGEHPQGVIAALGFRDSYDKSSNETSVFVVAIDLADERVLADSWLGYAVPGTIVDIASTPRGAVAAKQTDKALELTLFNGGTIVADNVSLPALAAKPDHELRAFTTLGDRIVVATGGYPTTTVWILDAQGRLLTSHACHGSLFAPGPAQLVQRGDDVLVTNFLAEGPEADRVPVCAGRLHGTPRWREVTLRDGKLSVEAAGIYFTHNGGADKAYTKALDDNLQPTGLPPPPATTPVAHPPCAGLTGTMLRHGESVGGVEVLDMEACCGDTGGGLFICRPAEGGRAR
jgi:serine/threonine-protein kinase